MVEQSVFTKPLTGIIEDAVTDTRGFNEVGRTRFGSIEDGLAVQEGLGRMMIQRAESIKKSTLTSWSVDNLIARALPEEVVPEIHREPGQPDTNPRLNVLIVSPDPKTALLNIVYGNINAHFGTIMQLPDGRYPMHWEGNYFLENEGDIIGDSTGSSLTELLAGNAHRLIHPFSAEG